MKRILAFALAAVFAMGLTACERRDQRRLSEQESMADSSVDASGDELETPSQQPEQNPSAQGDAKEAELAVRDCMVALQSGKRDNIDLHIDYDEFLGLQEGQADDNMRALLDRMEYEILDTDVDGQFATVSLDVSNIDMSEVLGEYLRQARDMEYNNNLSDSPKSDEQMSAEYLQLFENLLEQNSDNRREITVEIAVSRIDGWWRVQPDEDMRSAVFGDYFDVSKTIGPNAGGGQR